MKKIILTAPALLLKGLREEIKDWPVWWRERSLLRKAAPGALMFIYLIVLHFLGGLRNDHAYTAILILFLSYAGRLANILLRFILPVYLTGVVYDSQRYYSDFIRGEIHVAFPYEFDKKFFGITTEAGRLTPNEFLQLHIHPVLDLITGFFYLFFIGIYVLVCVWHSFFLAYFQKDHALKLKTKQLSPYVTWAFFWLNVIGYTTYYWFPAAPPWYVTLYGLGPANLEAAPNPAGCLRFDALLGTHFFTEMYGRSADVFGAIPSLHVAYPFLSFLFALRFKSLRVFSLGFYLIMCFSAVYLNHHYVIDILWGTAYAAGVYGLILLYSQRAGKAYEPNVNPGEK
jgi:inositol phosphorylceramide synthase catalytic subunit